MERYLETKSFNKTISDFVTKFIPPKRPYKSLIVLWVAKFRSEGTVRDLKAATPGRESHSGRKRKRSEEYVEALRESVAKSPHRPSRRRSQELGFEELKRLYPNTWTKMWFQQDGASPHAANKSLEWAKEHFKSRVISRKCEIEWPPYFPDLSPPQIFFFGATLKIKSITTDQRHWRT